VRHILITQNKEYDLPLGIVYLGRSPDCFIQLGEGAASRIHAKLTRSSNEVTLTDLGSLNGTFLNGSRVHDTRRLMNGDTLRIGDVFLVYRSKQSAQQEPEIQAPRPTVEIVFCPRCGGQLVAGVDECGHCEHSLPSVKAVTQSSICNYCQAIQAKAARFCGNCGREIRVVKIGG
jgi:predicted component of type VI protein secretion system